MRASPLVLLLALLLVPQGAFAQDAEPSSRTLPLGTRVVAGTVGSAAGALLFGVVGEAISERSCRTVSLGCGLQVPFLAGAVGSVVGSVAGTHLLARRRGESPSLRSEILASSVGVLAGTLVGAGLIQVIPRDGRVFVVGLSVTQGTLAALGSHHTAGRR